MAQDKSILEDAIIQMKNLEEAVAENAKGILGSVMSREIKELVKESLLEQEDEVEDEEDEEVEDDDMEDEPMDMEDDDMDMDDDDMSEPDMESPDTIDLTNAPTSQVLKVFKLMGPEDEIVVTKDSSDNINLKDNETGKEYMIMKESDVDFYDMSDMDDFDFEEEEEEVYEESYGMDDYDFDSEEEVYEGSYGMDDEEEIMYEVEMDDLEEDMDSKFDLEEVDSSELEEDEEIMYEVEMDDMEEEDEEEFIGESKKSFKAKGEGMGKPTFEYGKTTDFPTKKQPEGSKMPKHSGKSVKFEYDGEFGGEYKPMKKKQVTKSTTKKVETKEASRTLGNGKYWGREGLPKPKAAPRHIRKESIDNSELEILREKNEEYRKALNIFRNKLNEVAIFNSNLAYATRLFTEHSTSKQEKINILQRFDGVETLKESKNLYKTIKDELTTSKSSQITESIERKIERAPTTGSAVNLIESKTYENPQFMRMKDLMSKLK